MLLTDVFMIERLEVINESSGSKNLKVRGVFQRAEESNSNGRVYPSQVLTKQVTKLQDMISERRLCGELDHPQNDSVKLANASHLITKLEMKGNEVIGEAEILNTPAGLTARALINGGVKIGISSRGMGTLSEDSKGQKVVNEDFNLITFDLVADPSTRGAYPQLSESKTSQFVNESKTRLQKEENFVTMLKGKLKTEYKSFIHEMNLSPKQKELDVDDDGQIEGSDLAALRGKLKRGKKKKAKMPVEEGESMPKKSKVSIIIALAKKSPRAKKMSEANKQSRMKKFELAQKAGLTGRGADDYDGDQETMSGRAGQPGTGRGGIRQQVLPRGNDRSDTEDKVGAHSTDGPDRGVKKISGGPEHPGARMVARAALTRKLGRVIPPRIKGG